VQSGDPDYKDIPPEEAKRDFLRRISEYEKVYETITEPHLSYVKIVNVGAQVTLSRIHGYLQSRIAFYLMNLHLKPRSIYLSRVRRAWIPSYDELTRLISFSNPCSTEKASSTSKARSVEMLCSHRGEWSMQLLSPPWSRTTLGTRH
jgi:hypothetical protein